MKQVLYKTGNKKDISFLLTSALSWPNSNISAALIDIALFWRFSALIYITISKIVILRCNIQRTTRILGPHTPIVFKYCSPSRTRIVFKYYSPSNCELYSHLIYRWNKPIESFNKNRTCLRGLQQANHLIPFQFVNRAYYAKMLCSLTKLHCNISTSQWVHDVSYR
jgi:hypothetical protein